MAMEEATIERAMLGAILMEPERCLPLAVADGMAADWYTEDARALTWTAIADLWTERKPVDPMTVMERAKQLSARPKHSLSGVKLMASDVQAYIDDLPTAAHFEYYLRLGRMCTKDRRIKKAGARYAEDLKDGVDVDFAAQSFLDRLGRICGMGAASKAINMPAVLERIREDYAAAHQKRVVEKDLDYTPGIPLPWKAPNVSSQGVQEGLYYLGARPSVGKTAFMLNLFRFWCELSTEKFPNGVRVAFNSLDMAIKPMLKRPLAELARVSLTKASFGTTTHTDLKAIDRAIDGVKDADGNVVGKGVKDWPLTLIQERDVDAFRSWCIAARSSGRLDVAVVDFVQLMTTRHRYTNDNEKLEYVSGVLKSIAIDLDIPVIALSQLNRQCEEDGGRVPTASDLRGSGALEQDATAVWILHADRDVLKAWDAAPLSRPIGLTAGNTPLEFKGIGPVRFIIAKNQNGQAGPDVWFPFVFYKKYCLFMLGDVEATPSEVTTGAGATKKTVRDYSPLYARVTHDWRCDPFERVLRMHDCLVGFDLMKDKFLI